MTHNRTTSRDESLTSRLRKSINSSMPSIRRTQLIAVFFAVVMVASMPVMALGETSNGGVESIAENPDSIGSSNLQATNDYSLSEDNKTHLLFTGALDGNFTAVDTNTVEETFRYEFDSAVRDMELSSDESTMFFGLSDGRIGEFDLSSQTILWEIDEHDGRISNIGISPDESIIYAGGRSETATAHNIETGEKLWNYTDHGGTVGALELSQDGEYVYTGSGEDNKVKQLDAEFGEKNWYSEVPGSAREFAVSPDDDMLYAGFLEGNDAGLRAFDTSDGEEQWAHTSNANGVNHVITSHDGETIYTGYDNLEGEVRAFDADNGDLEWVNDPHDRRVGNVVLSPDGNTVYSGSNRDDIAATDVNSEDTVWYEDEYHESSPTALEVSSEYEDPDEVFSDPLSGQVTDRQGDPIENATVEAYGISPAPFDEDAVDDIQAEIQSLEDDLTDLEPEEWTDFTENFADGSATGILDVDDYRDDLGDTTYPLVHHEADWGVGTTTIIDSSIDDPRITTDTDETLVLSLWDPDQDGGWIENQVDQSFPGAASEGTIVVEQLGPSGVEDTRELDTSVQYETTGANPLTTNEHHAVKTSLPEGVYQAYPEDNSAARYTFTVGQPDDIFDSWANDLENRVTDLTDRADIFEDEIDLREDASFDDLLDEGIAHRERHTTNETGHVELDGGNVETLNVHAYKADDEILEVVEDITDPEDPSFDDLSISDFREYRPNYNGSF